MKYNKIHFHIHKDMEAAIEVATQNPGRRTGMSLSHASFILQHAMTNPNQRISLTGTLNNRRAVIEHVISIIEKLDLVGFIVGTDYIIYSPYGEVVEKKSWEIVE